MILIGKFVRNDGSMRPMAYSPIRRRQGYGETSTVVVPLARRSFVRRLGVETKFRIEGSFSLLLYSS